MTDGAIISGVLPEPKRRLIVWLLLGSSVVVIIAAALVLKVMPETYTNGFTAGSLAGWGWGLALQALMLHHLKPSIEERVLND